MKTHELKTWPGPFQAVLDGNKRAELRKDDRGFRVGDTLLLREYWPDGARPDITVRRALRCVVTHIVEGGKFGLDPEYVMLSITDVELAP